MYDFNRDAYPSRSRRGPRGLRLVLLLVFVALVAAAILAFVRRGSEAAITIEPGLSAVGPSTPIDVRIDAGSRGLLRVEIEAEQTGRSLTVAEREYAATPWWAPWTEETSADALTVEVGRDHWPELQQGEVTLTVRVTSAGSPFGGEATAIAEQVLPVRLVPPQIQSTAELDVVRQGGAGVAVYRVGESSVRDGVRVGELFFPGTPLPGADGAVPDPLVRFAFYAVPYDIDDPTQIRLLAEDDLGNRVERPFLQRFDRRTFRADDIQVGDGFLQEVVPEIQSQTPSLRASGSLVDDYVTINRDLRVENRARLVRLADNSSREILWHRPFLQLPNSRVMAGFGEDRSYFYQGTLIDRQTHLGYDLASIRHAEVPSAAGGVVMLAEFFGIYGNTVVVDHGQGIMSLYSHLSQIDVTVGDPVDRGTTVGRTGDTGLAGGDHLHFGVLVRGVQVDPIEWLDGGWIESRLASKLGPGFDFQR